MIQRIQSVYLFIAAIVALLLLFLPLGVVQTSLEGQEMAIRDYVLAREVLALMIVGLVMVSLALGAIFLYGNRAFQARVGWTALLSGLVFIGLFLLAHASELSSFKPAVGCFLPLVYLIVVVLAIRGIRSDDKLVRSADRFR